MENTGKEIMSKIKQIKATISGLNNFVTFLEKDFSLFLEHVINYLKLPFKLHIFTFFSINNIYMDFVQFNFT